MARWGSALRFGGVLMLLGAGLLVGAGTAVAETAGSYTGTATQRGTSPKAQVTFYVAPGGAAIQDISVPHVDTGCTPSSTLAYDHIAIAEIPITATTFSGKATVKGVIFSNPATITYTFSGELGAPLEGSAAGTLSEDISYTEKGTMFSCTSNLQTWSATRDSQPPQTLSPPPFGSYAGQSTQQGTSPKGAVTLYVGSNGKAIQDIVIPSVDMGCAPSSTLAHDRIVIETIPVKSSGSFKVKKKTMGRLFSNAATITYTFSGHLHGESAAKTERLGGTLREDIAYTENGTKFTCSSDLQAWSATQDLPAQANGPPSAGGYKGEATQASTSPKGVVSFSVVAGAKSIQNVSIPVVDEGCVPASSLATNSFAIETIPVNSSGAFKAKQATPGKIFGNPATITYTFNGHFHGMTSTGERRVAGLLREDISYTEKGTEYACTSNYQAWWAHQP